MLLGHVPGLLVSLDQQINLVSPQFEFIETVYINFWYCINFNVSLLEKKCLIGCYKILLINFCSF